MSKYVNHLLCYGKGADTVYQQNAEHLRLDSASPDTVLPESSILLTGGFTTILTDSPYPVSPTLQLNGDLAAFNENEMAAIGRAELIRANSQSYRSYILEPDLRVAVLSTDSVALNAFIERYGSILHLEPLLIKEYAPGITTAQELDIRYSNGRYNCSFMVKQPVDHDACTYCGKCGPSCPENCLSEHLFLDFSQCTLCKACENACPEQAIDLHTVEKHDLVVPALLLLSGTEINFSSRINKEKIFSEKNLEHLFDTIYAAQVDEVITWNQDICQYSGRLGIGCDVCVSACEHQALTRDHNGITIHHTHCTECGDCLAGCPTGALQYTRFTDVEFIEYFSNITLQPGTTIVIGCEHDLHKFWWKNTNRSFANTLFLEYPVTSALSSMHLFFLFALGAARICILQHQEDIPALLQQQTNLVHSVLSALFGEEERIHILQPESLTKALSRPLQKKSLYPLYHDFSFTNRREKIAHILSFLCRQSKKKQVRLTGAPVAQFGNIHFDTDKCTLCNACVGECRISALTADSNNFAIHHKPVLCVQCGSCVELCPEDAITLQPGLSLSPTFFEEKKQAQAEPVHCIECGKVFGTKQSLTRVMTVLTKKNLWDSQNDLLSYCDTCRVVKIFEAHNK